MLGIKFCTVWEIVSEVSNWNTLPWEYKNNIKPNKPTDSTHYYNLGNNVVDIVLTKNVNFCFNNNNQPTIITNIINIILKTIFF